MTPEQLEQVDRFREGAYAVIDRWCAAAVAETGPVCKPGCTDCCEALVTVSLLEAVVILRNDAGRAAFERNQERILETSNLLLARDPSMRLGPWKERRERCIFLGDCDRCLVYEDRPFNCRTHLAAKPCEPNQDGNFYVDPIEATRVSLILNQMASEGSGIPLAIAPLPFALIVADSLLKADVDTVQKAYAGTPLLDPIGSAAYWSYIEL